MPIGSEAEAVRECLRPDAAKPALDQGRSRTTVDQGADQGQERREPVVMRSLGRRKMTTLAIAGGLIAGMGGLVAYAPTLYQMFCAATGYGGTVQRALKVEAKAGGAPITVRMDSNVAPGLEWAFYPEQKEVQTRVGVPTQVYFDAANRSDQTIVARAVYNVTPYKVGSYFSKTECFCFQEEKLAPGESARMPVIFYVDPQMTKDPETKEVRTITLSYTFFKENGVAPAATRSVRDLGSGSKQLDARLAASGTAEFSSEVHHQDQ
jgi:cytochrome c oxidase assembly protein subunit 11